jgi:hypothetical protein
MFDPEIIFQRTQTGRDEIQKKSHGLTQSERLVLIMIDGASPYREVRAKLPVLADERFERALSNLRKKEQIYEVLMPIQGESAETLERNVIDRFLQQDPLDPVTIIFRDPEEELGLFDNGSAPESSVPAAPVTDVKPDASVSVPPPETPAMEMPPSEAAMDAHHTALADSLAQEVRELQADRSPKYEGVERRKTDRRVRPAPVAEPVKEGLHWGYVLIAIGLAFIVGFFIAKIGA